MVITSATVFVVGHITDHCVCKITEHTKSNTPKVLEVTFNIFLRPEEAMLLAWQSLSPANKNLCFFENI